MEMLSASSEPSVAALNGKASAHPADGWRARLELGFEADAARTVLRHRRHVGPLTVQRGFHPEGAPCHSYLLHPPGGVVGGDRLELDVSVADRAHALITTPAAGKFYRSAGPWASQRQEFRVAPGAALEWLPALNIVHGGARLQLRSRFDLAAGSRLIAWDLLGLGRPGSGDAFLEGAVDSRLDLLHAGRPLLSERLLLDGGAAALSAPWGLQGHGYLATLLAWPANRSTVDALRDSLGTAPGLRWGCTLLPAGAACAPDPSSEPGLLVCRWLARAGEALWEALLRAWSLLRPLVLGREPCAPRIWST